MSKPRRLISRSSCLLLLCLWLVSGTDTTGHAQQTQSDAQQKALTLLPADTAHGVELYQQGNYKEAIKLLKKASKKDKRDAVAWQFLGLALQQQGDQKGAQKALEQAVELRFAQLADAYSFNKKFAELTKAERAVMRAEQAQRDRAALAAVESYLKLSPKDAVFWREQADSLQFYIKLAEAPESEPLAYSASELSQGTRAIIFSKPEPTFTEKARRKGTTGAVMVRCVLGADGRVQHILVTKPLPNGLSERAVDATRQIQFKPAMKDGHAVSQFVTVAYNFNIY